MGSPLSVSPPQESLTVADVPPSGPGREPVLAPGAPQWEGCLRASLPCLQRLRGADQVQFHHSWPDGSSGCPELLCFSQKLQHQGVGPHTEALATLWAEQPPPVHSRFIHLFLTHSLGKC